MLIEHDGLTKLVTITVSEEQARDLERFLSSLDLCQVADILENEEIISGAEETVNELNDLLTLIVTECL